MNFLVVGASTGLGRSLADVLARHGHHLFLISSDERDLVPLAADLSLRYRVEVGHWAMDLAQPVLTELAARLYERFTTLDGLFWVAGLGSRADDNPLDDQEVERLLAVNMVSGIRIINLFLPHLCQRPKFHLVGIGSMAAVRGRGANMVYGSGKRGLEFYFEALRHRYSADNGYFQFYRMGYMATAMLANRGTLLPAANPHTMAEAIVSRLDRNAGMAYLPAWWFWVALVLKWIPWLLFKRLRIR